MGPMGRYIPWNIPYLSGHYPGLPVIYHGHTGRTHSLPLSTNSAHSNYLTIYNNNPSIKKTPSPPLPGPLLAYFVATTMCRCGHGVCDIELCLYGHRAGPRWCPYGHCVRRAVPRRCTNCQTLLPRQLARLKTSETTEC